MHTQLISNNRTLVASIIGNAISDVDVRTVLAAQTSEVIPATSAFAIALTHLGKRSLFKLH